MKTKANITFGKRIANLRTASGISQEELAFRCHLDRTYIGTIERGEKSATINTIDKLAKGLGLRMCDIFNY